MSKRISSQQSNKKRRLLGKRHLIPLIVLTTANMLIPVILLMIRRRRIKRRVAATRSSPSSSTNKNGNQLPDSYVRTRDSLTPPLNMGPHRFHYQYAAVIPQTYLTLISVLQGIVFGVLLLNFPLPKNLSIESIRLVFVQQFFYLPYVISSMIILAIWSQLVQAILFLTWPFTPRQTTLIFFLSLLEILAFTNIGNFSIWLGGLGTIGIVGGVIRLNNIGLLLKKEPNWISPMSGVSSLIEKDEKNEGLTYMGLGFFTVVLAFAVNPLTALTVQHHLPPSFVHWFILGSYTVILTLIIVIGERDSDTLFKEIIRNSDLSLSRRRVLGYKRVDEVDKPTDNSS